MQSGGSAYMADSKYVKWGTHLTIQKSKSWKKQVNKGKNGRRFEYSVKLFESLTIIKTYTGISYRACQGIAQNVLGSNAPDHTTICRRINALKIKTPEKVQQPSDQLKDIYLAIDGSGIKPNERGEWIRDKWKIRRGFIKIHLYEVSY
ncbi:MAG: Transposase DDE domain protein [Cenarchaeum symbiont of Oopsacas minuta]|nr:Transposase DDE domain protein [Cenarchaeum symbiont of Oopsacas minuta]